MKKRSYTILSDAKKRSLVRHYEAGMEWRVLAEKFKVSEGTITNILRDHRVSKTRCIRGPERTLGQRIMSWLAGWYA
jgi:transposase